MAAQLNQKLLSKHIQSFLEMAKKNPLQYQEDIDERISMIKYYQSFDIDRINKMSEEEVYEYLSQLWAMRIWGNKHYKVNIILSDNGLKPFRDNLAALLWGSQDIAERWNSFRTKVKGMGPAMMSEILCKTHPNDFILWNRRAFVALKFLGVDNLPRYDYQLNGKMYNRLCVVAKDIASELGKAGYKENTLLDLDYFIWHELQVEDNLSKIHDDPKKGGISHSPKELEFVHDDIRDKISDIGQWLGFQTRIERKVSEGSRVDTLWESTIGNMGRVIYVFEVQTKGSIDSLILNLLKSLNNPAVQGVVAVSDKIQLEKIRDHVKDVKELRDKLKYWDYEEVSKIHESLEYVNASINELGLVPQGFY